MRPIAEKRHNDWYKAIRKRRIDRECDAASPYHKDWYDNLHQYSKNKIHCSCPLCACKTTNKHGRMWWAPKYNPSIRDRKIQDSMDDSEYELGEADN